MEKVLITGGAGFIGSTIVDKLYKKMDVVVLDSFSEQIHGPNFEDSYLFQKVKDKATVIKGDVRNRSDLEKALDGVSYIIHLAAETGTGQSMYQITAYTDVNIMGTSNLLQVILDKKLPIKKIVLSSSRSVYGEGAYFSEKHGVVSPKSRTIEDMKLGDFEPKCPISGENVILIETKETSPTNPISYYAYTKLAQEKMLEVLAPTLGIEYTIFRYQNVYGAGQSLNNPYTGILSIFSKLLLAEKEINIFEDGLESRDFVHVSDVADITINALTNDKTNSEVINVGSGERVTVIEVAETLKKYYQSDSKINITGDFRVGDIRHNIADISKAKEISQYNPQYTFEIGMNEFADWVKSELNKHDLDKSGSDFDNSIKELKATGMMFGAD